jgi:hypothetical protein
MMPTENQGDGQANTKYCQLNHYSTYILRAIKELNKKTRAKKVLDGDEGGGME